MIIDISLIVPVYNLEKYISKCLDSLINQTHKNIEIICVNDGSDDNSLHIIEEYQSKDDRIIIINQKNQGVSQSRNNALKIARGRYIMFIDGDDWIDENTCEFALNRMIKNNVDAVIWTYVREYQNKSLTKDIFEEDSIYFDKKQVHERIYRRIFGLYDIEMARPDHGDSIVPIWGKLYKKDIIINNNIEFIDYKIVAAEDALFNMKYFSYVDNVYYEKKYLYHYRKNDESLTRSYNERLFYQWNNLILNMQRELKIKKLDTKFEIALQNRRCLSLIPLGLNAIYKESGSFKEVKCLLNDKNIQCALQKLKFDYLPFIWKIFFLSAKYKINFLFYALLKAINFKVH